MHLLYHTITAVQATLKTPPERYIITLIVKNIKEAHFNLFLTTMQMSYLQRDFWWARYRVIGNIRYRLLFIALFDITPLFWYTTAYYRLGKTKQDDVQLFERATCATRQTLLFFSYAEQNEAMFDRGRDRGLWPLNIDDISRYARSLCDWH